jgi:hypothetical protein
MPRISYAVADAFSAIRASNNSSAAPPSIANGGQVSEKGSDTKRRVKGLRERAKRQPARTFWFRWIVASQKDKP